jgi:uncharacterized protein
MIGQTASTPPRTWILMSPYSGDNTQLLALAGALGYHFEVKRLAFRRAEWLPRILLGATLMTLDRAHSSALAPPYPELIIGAGRRTEAVAFYIRKKLNPSVRLVYLGSPWARLDQFDLVITTPQYRLPRLPNVVHNTLPLHDVGTDRLALAAKQWEPALMHLPKPRIAVLVGGRSGPYLFDESAAARLGQEASARARMLGAVILLTTSARTSPNAARALVQNISVPFYCHEWKQDETANPYHAFLALADEVIVTADSISMITEACATGKPTYLFDTEEGPRAMRAEEGVSSQRGSLPPVHWKGGDISSTAWRLGLNFGPDWWTRDIRIVHREVVERGWAAWLGTDTPCPRSSNSGQDMKNAVSRIRSLMGMP